MATTRLYLDKRTLDAAGCGTLRLMLSHRNTTTSCSLNIKLRPDEWNGSEILCKKDKKQLDAIIQKKKSDIDMAIFRMETSGEPMPKTASEVMLKVHKVLEPERFQERGHYFMKVYNDVMAQKEGNTRLAYRCALHKLLEFDPALKSRTFEDMDLEYFNRFIKYMDEDGLSWNGERNYLRSIRAVFNHARDEGLSNQYPFRKIDMSPTPTKKRSLSLSQLQTLRTMPLQPWQEEYRDMFMLMFYLIGINAVDLFNAKPDQIVNGRLEYLRSKTRSSSKEAYSVKIEPEAQEIIDKYRGSDWLLSPLDRYGDYTNYLRHMNSALGKFGMVFRNGRKTKGEALFPGISSYWARHSWATIAYELGYPVDIIGQALGHVDSGHAVTMIYIKADQRKVDEANRAVMDALFGKA